MTFRADLERTLRLSRFAERVAHARPAVIEALEVRDAAPVSRAEMLAALEGAPEGLGSRLRQLRERVMVTLAHRDLNGHAPLGEVFDTMTALAEVCVAAAATQAHREAVERFGEPRDAEGRALSLIVAALGKLGGGELNVSSDIDLIFLHAEEGDTRGPRPVSHREFFAHAGKTVIALLSEITNEGLAFRVDMRLWPFGISGPLSCSLAALEDYFVVHARPWERYAWLKARVISGEGEAVRALVDPFVYRRYLDYGLVGALRDLHARIFETAISRRKADDIKVGAGGIGEIEFCVQLVQLIRGGRERELRLTSTRKALATLAERSLIEPERARALGEAYAFLRRLEHRLQYYDDQQTQSLPRDDGHRAAIAEGMGFADWNALAAELAAHRDRVQASFNALFEGAPAPTHAAGASIVAWLNDPQAAPDAEGLAEDLAEAGFGEARAAAARLIEFTGSRRYRAMSASLRAKVEKVLPLLVATSAENGGETTLARLLRILESIDRREAYVALLLEFPQVLARATRLVSKSAWAARLLARHPILLDELTRSAASFTATDWADERKSLQAECEAHGADLERVLDELRLFKQRHVFRLTIADLEGELPVMALSDELSALADTILEVALRVADRSAIPGAVKDGEGPGSSSGFAVIGYGKLGGKELGYGSDLDLVFVYDAERAGEQAPRLAQRLITWLTSHTAAGVLYETDLRLRPDGAKGVLVSSLAGVATYQRTRAWTWEHQALTRARFCAGDPELGARFEALKDEILAAPRDGQKLLDDIRAMRSKMRAEQRRDAQELKHIEGGVIDLEFCVQALVLLHGPAHPALRENKGNHALLRRAGELGLIDPALAADAGHAYLEYRRRIHQAALNDEERVLVAPDDLVAERDAVRRLWAAVL
jgi:glutamate-ammonia-ligase adenylyltransferase